MFYPQLFKEEEHDSMLILGASYPTQSGELSFTTIPALYGLASQGWGSGQSWLHVSSH